MPSPRQKGAKSWPRHLLLINCYHQFSGKLGDRSRPYCRQHIILDVYIQFEAKIRRRRFGQFFFAILYPQEFFDFSLKIEVKDFWDFCQNPALDGPDNTFTKF